MALALSDAIGKYNQRNPGREVVYLNYGAVDPALTVTDADSTNLTGATVSITAGFTSGQDVLAFATQNDASSRSCSAVNQRAARISPSWWTMGSFSGASYTSAATLLGALVVCGGALLLLADALNAFAAGESNALSVGVNVRMVKPVTLVCVAALTGACVAVGGTIGFVGLVVPHMARMLFGPDHRRLLPESMFSGAIFLMLCDLAARAAFAPRELPVGVITSFIGAAAFLYIFYTSRKRACG